MSVGTRQGRRRSRARRNARRVGCRVRASCPCFELFDSVVDVHTTSESDEVDFFQHCHVHLQQNVSRDLVLCSNAVSIGDHKPVDTSPGRALEFVDGELIETFRLRPDDDLLDVPC